VSEGLRSYAKSAGEVSGRMVFNILGGLRVGKGAWHKTDKLQGDVKCGVGLQVAEGSRKGGGDDRRDHIGAGWDVTHNNSVAGPGLDLKPVGQSLAGTVVDEVRIVCVGRGLALLNGTGIESCRCAAVLHVRRQ
jgi:hypothetical protein